MKLLKTLFKPIALILMLITFKFNVPNKWRKDVAYILLIINIFIGFYLYLILPDFYKEIIITNNVEAKEIDIKKEPKELGIEEWVMNEAKKAGLDEKEVWAIIQCESRWNSYVVNVNNNGTYDSGLWQINSIHKDISNECKFDYKCSTEWAIEKRLKDGNWCAWRCAYLLGFCD